LVCAINIPVGKCVILNHGRCESNRTGLVIPAFSRNCSNAKRIRPNGQVELSSPVPCNA
jgi:hypothetical protein